MERRDSFEIRRSRSREWKKFGRRWTRGMRGLENFKIFMDVICVLSLRLTSKFMTSHTGQQIITMHILPNISKYTDNQGMKFGPLIEYNMKNIFLQKSCKKRGKETSSRPFSFVQKNII